MALGKNGGLLWCRAIGPPSYTKLLLLFDPCRNNLTERKECSVNYYMYLSMTALEYKLNLARIFIASRDLLH